MPSTVTNDSKNNATVTNETKTGNDITIDEMVVNIDDAGGTIDSPGVIITNDTKNSATVTNDTKN